MSSPGLNPTSVGPLTFKTDKATQELLSTCMWHRAYRHENNYFDMTWAFALIRQAAFDYSKIDMEID